MSAREIPTLRVEESGPFFRIVARSYDRDAPSGLGEFGTREDAECAMKALNKRLDDQRTSRGPTKKEVRRVGAD